MSVDPNLDCSLAVKKQRSDSDGSSVDIFTTLTTTSDEATTSQAPTMEEKECLICLCSLKQGFVTPCNHEFCYVCLNQVMNNTGYYSNSFRCPICRGDIPREAITKATMDKSDLLSQFDQDNQEYRWLYGGRADTFWLYSPQLSDEIEAAYKKFAPYESGFIQYLQDHPNALKHPNLRKPYFHSTQEPTGICDCKMQCTTPYCSHCSCQFCNHYCADSYDYSDDEEEDIDEDDGEDNGTDNMNNNSQNGVDGQDSNNQTDNLSTGTQITTSDPITDTCNATAETPSNDTTNDTCVSDPTNMTMNNSSSTTSSSTICSQDNLATPVDTIPASSSSTAVIDSTTMTDAIPSADSIAATATEDVNLNIPKHVNPRICSHKLDFAFIYALEQAKIATKTDTGNFVQISVHRSVLSKQSLLELEMKNKALDEGKCSEEEKVSSNNTSNNATTFTKSPIKRTISRMNSIGVLGNTKDLSVSHPTSIVSSVAHTDSTTNMSNQSSDDNLVQSTSTDLVNNNMNSSSDQDDYVQLEVDASLPFTIVFIGADQYGIDFVRKIQFPINHPTRSRVIRRSSKKEVDEASTNSIKGVSGIRFRDTSTLANPSSLPTPTSTSNSNNP